MTWKIKDATELEPGDQIITRPGTIGWTVAGVLAGVFVVGPLLDAAGIPRLAAAAAVLIAGALLLRRRRTRRPPEAQSPRPPVTAAVGDPPPVWSFTTSPRVDPDL